MPHKVGSGAILGIVSEDGVPAQKRITLMDRSDLSIVQRAVSDEYGAYAFTGLNPDTDDYIIFAVDDDGVEKKAAIMYDYVRPIPAHQGGFYWGNWYYLSSKKDPACSILMMTDSDSPTSYNLPYGAGMGATIPNGYAIDVNKQPMSPAAADLASIELVGSNLRRSPLNINNIYGQKTPLVLSFEWLLDLPSVTSSDASIMLSKAYIELGKFYYKLSPLMVSYYPATKKVVMYRHPVDYDNVNYNTSLHSLSVTAVEYVIPVALQSEVIHISGTIEYGLEAVLYINGQTVATQSLVGTNTSVGLPNRFYSNSATLFMMGSRNLVNSEADFYTNFASLSSSLACLYTSKLTQQEALGLYQALFVESSPIVTGYLKGVLSNYPDYLYRLYDEDSSLTVSDALRFNAPTGTNSKLQKINPSMLSHSNDSLVVGGSGMIFNGGALKGWGFYGSSKSPLFATIEFMAKPSAGYSNSVQSVVSHNANASTFFIEVRIKEVTGEWGLAWRESGAEVVVYFPVIADTSAIKHYAFIVDKKNRVASLYVDGVVAATVSELSIKLMDMASTNTGQSGTLLIGGRADDVGSPVARPYFGYLAEVAMYPAAIPAVDIKSHYEARLII